MNIPDTKAISAIDKEKLEIDSSKWRCCGGILSEADFLSVRLVPS